jgi:putative ABC transport system permease protein
MMLILLLRKATGNRKGSTAVAVLAVAAASALAAALITVSLDLDRSLSKELQAFGANFIVVPQIQDLKLEILGRDYGRRSRYLRASELYRLKTIFWRHNIIGIVPYLFGEVRVLTGDQGEGGGRPLTVVGTWFERELIGPGQERPFRAGLKLSHGRWTVRGRWAKDSEWEAMVGIRAAQELGVQEGDVITVRVEGGADSARFTVVGVIEAGNEADGRLFLPLERLQDLLGLPDAVSEVRVSALVTPPDSFAERARANPDSLTPEEYERWYCTAYPSSIAKQIEEVLTGAQAKPVWRLIEANAAMKRRLQWMAWAVSALALAIAAFGVTATMGTMIIERRREIALMIALGAEERQLKVLFISEALVIGGAGGLLGYLGGSGIAWYIGKSVFGLALAPSPLAFTATLLLGLGVVLAGIWVPLVQARAIEPAALLGG